jgi:hypothetical protein
VITFEIFLILGFSLKTIKISLILIICINIVIFHVNAHVKGISSSIHAIISCP